MDYFSARNAVILALLPTGAVVTGVLGTGAVHKWYAQFNMALPAMTTYACAYGFVALVVPVIWAVLALAVLRHKDEDATPCLAIFLTGVIVLLLLLVGVYQAAAQPLLHLFCGCGGLSS